MRYVGLLARLLYDPAGAVSALRAERPIGHSVVASILATIVYELALTSLVRDIAAIVRFGSFDEGAARILLSHLLAAPYLLVPLVFISAVYVPASLFFLGVLVRGATAAEYLRRDYGTSLCVALSVWAATLSVWLVPALLLGDPGRPWTNRIVWSILPAATFVVPMVVNFARVGGAGYGRATAAALLGGVSLYVFPLAERGAALLLTSPLVLIITFFVLRGVFREWSTARSARERFERGLEAATLNPADASAHVNLGIIYQERGDVERATHHFRRALEIDPDELDARYGLGVLLRESGRLAEAIGQFDAVVQSDADFRNAEVWREIGSTYHAAGQYEDALAAYDRFVGRRPSDAEGLYRRGLTLASLGRADEARASMRAVVDAVRTAPVYKYRLERRWLAEAETYLRNS